LGFVRAVLLMVVASVKSVAIRCGEAVPPIETR